MAPSRTLPSGSLTGFPSEILSSNPTLMPTEPQNLTFCVIADAPYSPEEAEELPLQIEAQMEGCEFLVHLGDIFVGDTQCEEYRYVESRDIMLDNSVIPTFVVPGDNEWNDCSRKEIDAGWNRWT